MERPAKIEPGVFQIPKYTEQGVYEHGYHWMSFMQRGARAGYLVSDILQIVVDQLPCVQVQGEDRVHIQQAKAHLEQAQLELKKIYPII